MTIWTEAELALLRANYENLGAARVALMLGRPESAVRNKAYRVGVTSPRPWTSSEDEALRARYTAPGLVKSSFLDGFAQELGRSRWAVAMRASRLGLTDISRKSATPYTRGSRAKYATREERAEAVRQRFATNGHPRGYLGRKHSVETRAKLGDRCRATWADPNSRFHETDFKQARADALSRMAAARVRAGFPNPYSRALRGARSDLGDTFFRSRWEANYARHLNALMKGGSIVSWEYEPRTFWFEAIRRGVRSYTPDFCVQLWDGSHEWHEVKGWLDPKSKTKLKRMKKYHPSERVVVVDERFFRQCERTGYSGTIPYWEYKRA